MNAIKPMKGFTLIELLIVVAIIAVLAGIAVPNFLEAQTRSKIARARAELAVLSTGLGRYYAEHEAYPPNHPEVTTYLETALASPLMAETITTAPEGATIPWYYQQLDSMGYSRNAYNWKNFPPLKANGHYLAVLTTPVAYLEHSLPQDMFDAQRSPYVYLNSYDLFTSDKPRDYSGLQGDHLTSATHYLLASEGPDGFFNMYHAINGPWIPYDPTNGTVSNGDLFLFEGRTPSVVLSDEMVDPATVPILAQNPDELEDPMLMEILGEIGMTDGEHGDDLSSDSVTTDVPN